MRSRDLAAVGNSPRADTSEPRPLNEMGKLAQKLRIGIRGYVKIELEEATYLPGDILRGRVVVRITQAVHRATLQLAITGVERLKWWSVQEETVIPHCRCFCHLDAKILLDDNNRMIFPGTYTYPIEFQLPMDLLQSYEYKTHRVSEMHRVRARLVYSARASLRVHSFLRADCDDSTTFQVDTLPSAVPLQKSVVVSKAVQPRLLAMFRVGACGMKLEMSNDVHDVSVPSLPVQVCISNGSQRRLKSARVVLYQDTHVDRHCRYFNTIQKSSRRIVEREIPLAHCADVLLSKWHGELQPERHDVRLVVPVDALPTMLTHFVAISYRVAIECSLSLCRRVSTSTPLTLVRQPSQTTDAM